MKEAREKQEEKVVRMEVRIEEAEYREGCLQAEHIDGFSVTVTDPLQQQTKSTKRVRIWNLVKSFGAQGL